MATGPLDSQIEDRRPLREVVYHRLKDAIIEGQLRPGEHLVETKLAERLGVSRAPVREAILSLERENLVRPSTRGKIVSSFTREGIEEVYTVRATLERLACGLAARHITAKEKEQLRDILERSKKAVAAKDLVALTATDIEFHDVLIRAGGNATLRKVLDQLRDSVRRFRLASIALPGRPREVLKDHTAIAEAVIRGDAERAEQLVFEHILQAGSRLVESTQDPIQ